MLRFVCGVRLSNFYKGNALFSIYIFLELLEEHYVNFRPISCGFLKALCYKTFTTTPQSNCIKQQTGEILMQQYESFQNVFHPDNFHVS